jgi:hypothetical protein
MGCSDYLGGLRQGWAFAWRSLMAAELIAYSPALGQGLGQLLNMGRELFQMAVVITSITLILVVGFAIELLIFAPVERRVLARRGLTMRWARDGVPPVTRPGGRPPDPGPAAAARSAAGAGTRPPAAPRRR